jgi:DnaA family protein
MQQLTLPVRLSDEATFANFLSAPGNAFALAALRKSLEEQAEGMCYLRGAQASGRSHLLQALCHAAGDRGLAACYLPLQDLYDYPAKDVLAGLDSQHLICLDDLDAVAGDADWEEALFHLFNRCQQGQLGLCISATGSPQELGIALPDLASRLRLMLDCRLSVLADEEKQAALQLRAQGIGINMPDEVAGFILRHLERDMSSLVAFLIRLDLLSIAEKRRITVPFVSDMLARERAPGENSDRTN